jgi:hypothetical protein
MQITRVVRKLPGGRQPRREQSPPAAKPAAVRTFVMNMTIREEIDQLSSQVTKLQLQLSLALLELKRRPLHQQQPANDNVNDAGDLVA